MRDGWKRVLALLTAVVLLMVYLPTNVRAEEAYAVRDIEGITAAMDCGAGALEVIQDLTMNDGSEIVISDATLDLGGYTLEFKSGTIVLDNATIRNGEVQYKGKDPGLVLFEVEGNSTVENVTFTAKKNCSLNTVFSLKKEGELTLDRTELSMGSITGWGIISEGGRICVQNNSNINLEGFSEGGIWCKGSTEITVKDTSILTGIISAENGAVVTRNGIPIGQENGSENIERSGTCGDELTWNLDSEGKLTISGNGKMEDYDGENSAPWAQLVDEIKTVVIEEGVTYLGAKAFSGCVNLSVVSCQGEECALEMGKEAIPEGVDIQYNFYHLGALNYTVNNDAITERCAYCDGESATAVIRADNADYTGSALETGWVVYPDHWRGEKPTLVYQNNCNAGRARVSVSITGTDNNKATAVTYFQILPKEVSKPNIILSQNTYSFDGHAKEPIVCVYDGTNLIDPLEYAVTYSDNLNAGTAAVTVTDKAGGNYTVTGSTSFTINKVNSTLTDIPTANQLTYNGQSQMLVTEGTATGGTLLYSLNGGAYIEDVPTGTGAGKYTVSCYGKGDNNHADTETISFEVSIAPKTISEDDVTLEGALSYNGEKQTQNVAVADDITHEVCGNTGTEAGKYTLTVTGTGNYTGEVKLDWSISTANPTVTPPTANELTYTGAEQALVTPGITTGGSMYYSLDGETWSREIPTGTDAKAYTIFYYAQGDANHGDTEKAFVEVTIAPKTITKDDVTLDGTLTYTGKAQTQKITVKNGVDCIVTGNQATNAGGYTLTVAGTGNYAGEVKLDWSIAKAAGAAAVFVADQLTYSGGAQPLVTAAITEGGTLIYSLNGRSWSETIPTGNDAGTYTVYYFFRGDENHADGDVDRVDVTIAPKAITSDDVWLDGALTYTGEAQTQTIRTTEGVTYEISGNTGVNAGDYVLTVSGTGNYTGEVKRNWSIAKAAAGLTTEPRGKELTYTGQSQALVTAGCSEDGIVFYSLDGETWSETAPAAVDAGTYTVCYYVRGDENHTDVQTKAVDATITKATPTVAAPEGKELSYTGQPQTLVTAGTAQGGTLLYSLDGQTWSENLPQSADAGEYTVYYMVAGGENYTGTVPVALTVTIWESSVVENPDGSITTITIGRDGSVKESLQAPEGVTETTVTDANGTMTQIWVTIPASAVEEGKTATLPATIPTGVEVEIDVPTEGTTLEIPLENVTPGTVVVIVHEDGTEAVISNTAMTENGLLVTIDENAAVKIEDRSQKFDDVSGQWYNETVDFVSSRDLMTGIGDDLFDPNGVVTRAQFVTILYRLAGEPVGNDTIRFTDVSEGRWYTGAIKWAASVGITRGYGDGTFGVEDEITREQMAAMMYRYAEGESTACDLSHFEDACIISDYAKEAIAWANANGILNGMGDGTLKPQGEALRAQAAQIIMNYIQSSL